MANEKGAREKEAILIGVRNLMEKVPKLTKKELLRMCYSENKRCPEWAIDKVCKEKNINPDDWGSFEYDHDLPPQKFKDALRQTTDKMALARLFYEKQPIYFDEAGIFWLWDHESKSWKMKDEVDIENMIYLSSPSANTINSKERGEILQALKQVGRLNKPKPLPKTRIQFKNGVVDVDNPHIVIEPTQEYFSVNLIPWNIGSNDKTPSMDKIFEQWVGKEYVQTLYEILSYCLIPDYPLQRIFCLLGDGRNGKSKFLELIRKFIGEKNICSTELDVLLNSRFEVTRLYSKLVCQMGETNFNEMKQTSMLKKLTGGDMIGFEFKNKNPFEAMNYAKIIIATNNLPTTSDKTDGFYRRWLLIDFPNKFDESKDILSEIPEEEYENLAFKCIFILKRLLSERKFTNEGTYEDRMKKYEEKSNPFDKFWNETLEETDLERHITKHDFKTKINQWCKEKRYRELSDPTINEKMKEKKISESRKTIDWQDERGQTQPKQARVWLGIRWKN